MSQSGIPVVSQIAQTVHTIGTSIGDIFEGKNVFEALGRIVSAPVTGALDLVNDISFNTLAHTPVVGGTFQAGRDLHFNPYDAGAAKDLAINLGKDAAILATAGVITPLGFSAPAALGISQGAGALGGIALTSGNLSGALNSLAPGVGSLVPEDVKNLYNQYAPVVGSLIPKPEQPSYSPNLVGDRTFPSPAQTLKSGFDSTQVMMLLAGAGLVFYLAVKK